MSRPPTLPWDQRAQKGALRNERESTDKKTLVTLDAMLGGKTHTYTHPA
jgi:hypothetical protein